LQQWSDLLREQKTQPYFEDILTTLQQEQQNHTVFPPAALIFNAFKLTPLEKLKVVILGQDPYHGAGQAHGLSFSVPENVNPPPSLINIFKEIKDDIGEMTHTNGNLENWAKQGVLLLNSVLSVRAQEAGSHRHLGWEKFTDQVIMQISHHQPFVVFLLWGSYAQKKAMLIDKNKHAILCAPHPSPLSAYRGFMGCKHFSATNELLTQKGLDPIDWST